MPNDKPRTSPSGPEAVLLEADRVSVEIDGAVLLPETSVRLAAGRCVAILGPNGAGKTTLLRVLAGRTRATRGTALLRGRPIDERRPQVRREIAALLDTPTLYPDLTLRENVALIQAAWSGANAGEELAPGLGSDALDSLGIAALSNRFAHELSSGQRQLVSLAVTLARPANLLLLDEPEQRLDPDRRGLVAETMLAARARGATIAFASHDADLVERVADDRVRVGG